MSDTSAFVACWGLLGAGAAAAVQSVDASWWACWAVACVTVLVLNRWHRREHA